MSYTSDDLVLRKLMDKEDNDYYRNTLEMIVDNNKKHNQGTDYSVVEYRNKKYIVGKTCSRTKNQILFITDASIKKYIKHGKWHRQSQSDYISLKMNSNKELYLHYLALNKIEFGGRGQTYTIDHINRIPWDNRKENLRVTTQTQQNFNQRKKKRKVELPEDCGIDPDDLPKNVWYVKPTGNFGEYFEVRIKDLPDGSTFRKKTTKSKTVSLKCKLEEVKHYLKELQKKFPDAIGERGISSTYSDEAIKLIKSYNKIIKLSGFDNYKDFLVEVPENKDHLENNVDELEDSEKEKLNLITQAATGKKRTTDTLPEDCGVTREEIPKYCYYKPASGNRSDCFTIDRHPKLVEQGKRQWSTTSASKFTTKEKFDLLLEKIEELEE